MAKTLKEALLEQMAALQERGLAPGEIPAEEQEVTPSYAQYDGESDRRSQGGDRDADSRRGTAVVGGRAPRLRSRPDPPRAREQREREPRGGRERREPRVSRDERDIPQGLVAPAPAPLLRPPLAPRPPGPPHMGQPGGMNQSGAIGPRPAPRSDMLRRNAERIQREQSDRNDLRQLLTGYNGGEEVDDAGLDKFFSQLAVETGALPPINIVLEALRSAGNADPSNVADQVRIHYRRARSRPAPTPVAVT